MEDIVDSLRHPAPLVAPCILLLLAERPNHGYELMDRLREFGFADGSSSTVYRELRRLEDCGFVCSTWEASQIRGPARRVYELTPSGRDTLAGCIEGASDLSRTLTRYMRRARTARRVDDRYRTETIPGTTPAPNQG